MSDLHVEIEGSGPPVVLVHGTGPPAWGRLPGLLATHHTVVSYDRRGFPPSPGAPGGSLRSHGDDLAAIIEHHGGRAAVVGWSIGGVIPLDLGLRRPKLMERLIILEAPLRAATRPTVPLLRAVLGARRRARRSPEDGARHFLSWALSRTDAVGDLDRLDPGRVRETARSITAELRVGTGEKEIRANDLAGLEVPTRWLVGTHSAPEFAAAARRGSQDLGDRTDRSPRRRARHPSRQPRRRARRAEGLTELRPGTSHRAHQRPVARTASPRARCARRHAPEVSEHGSPATATRAARSGGQSIERPAPPGRCLSQYSQFGRSSSAIGGVLLVWWMCVPPR